MADTFSNDLRVRLQESGSNAGSWGDLLNGTITNLASALGQGSEAIPNASTHTITLADGTADEARSLYLKCTGGGQACTVTLGPNTISKVWIIDNATSYTLTFSQGSGANVAIAAGAVKVIATDGAGSGAAVVDTLDGLEGSFSSLAVTGAFTSPGIDDNANATAITIDSSENVLVGKTSFDSTTVGAIVRPTGAAILVVDGGDALLLNRKTSDGSIIDFRKDNTAVGSIGVDNNDNFQIGATTSGHGGLYFGNGSIAPMAGNSRVQDTLDLGNATYRFKDLHLSGGAYLGGTAAANKLDDYEEGVFQTSFTTNGSGSITLNSSYNTMYYTKIGRVVHVNGLFSVSSVSSPVGVLKVSLPFVNKTNASNSSAPNAFMNGMGGGIVGDIIGLIDTGSNTANFYYGSAASVTGTVANNVQAGTDMRFSATYITDL